MANTNINVVGFNTINEAYTNIITEYIRKGYVINIPTMRGMQNEITKTDFVATDKTLVRVMITKGIERIEGCGLVNYTRITELRYNNKTICNGRNTVWNDRADEINILAEFYAINDAAKYYEDGNSARFVKTTEDYNNIKNIQSTRSLNKNVYGYDEVREINVSVENKAKIIGIINTRWGYKRTTINDIEEVFRTTDTKGVRYTIKIKNKNAIVIGR